jgi:ubiquitin carboxyl-terminal hydrolase 1
VEIIAALTKHSERKENTLFASREHQDAQELFQLVSECIKNEAVAVEKEGQRDRGFGGLASTSAVTKTDLSRSVFDGLTANRRSCVECGYTEAVMHFGFDNWQLAVPRAAVGFLLFVFVPRP